MTTAIQSTRLDVYTRVTNRIVEALEAGVRPWMKPWHAEHAAGRITRPLRHNGQKYSGINILTLWMSAELQGFASPFWMTFQQTKDFGAHVKKGEHGSPVVYAATFKKTETTDDGQDLEQDIPFLKEYTVFYVYSYCTIVDLEFRLAGMTGFAPATSMSRTSCHGIFLCKCNGFRRPYFPDSPSFSKDSGYTSSRRKSQCKLASVCRTEA
jgi:hypothetical protein